MIELAGEIPFLWRLSAESSDGYCSVAMVVPCPPEAEIADLTIETSVVSMPSEAADTEQEEILEWNQDDITLFLKLITHRERQQSDSMSDTVRVNLTDPDIIDIIQVVAAAGFGMAFTAQGVLQTGNGYSPIQNYDIGSFASLNTVRGFKSCVIVDVDEDNVVCVLLDDIPAGAREEFPEFNRLDLLVVSRADLLHPEFAERKVRPEGTPLH
ncbi:MAG: hypothetical protein ACR2PR_01860 [Pseudohongiellaceae bacterium]